jgi:transcriptional regulator with XRE-family HTH domain
MHKGEIIEKIVRESNIPLTQIAKKLGVTRRTIYNIFEKYNVDNDTVLKIGKIIYYDFSIQFPQLKKVNIVEEPSEIYNEKSIPELKREVELWKSKYIELLEEYNKLLKK